jgi:protein-tyrosine phosphatase
MNQITPMLYVTDIKTVRETSLPGITHVVTVCQDDVRDNVGCDYDYFCMSDGPAQGYVPGDNSYEMFEEACECVIESLESDNTVLVHCHAGRSRSVAVCTATLAVTGGLTYEEAFNRVREARPIANSHPLLRDHAERFIETHAN